jgi:hypothetical protein
VSRGEFAKTLDTCVAKNRAVDLIYVIRIGLDQRLYCSSFCGKFWVPYDFNGYSFQVGVTTAKIDLTDPNYAN